MTVNILIADDAAAVRKSVRNLLEREQFHVVGEACDGPEAVHLTAVLAPDVVILDLYMPQMDGLKAARCIRSSAPHTRLVMLTVDATEEYIFAAMDAGFTGYVQKSDAPEDLARAVYEVCSGGRYLSLGPSRVILDALLSRAAQCHGPHD